MYFRVITVGMYRRLQKFSRGWVKIFKGVGENFRAQTVNEVMPFHTENVCLMPKFPYWRHFFVFQF